METHPYCRASCATRRTVADAAAGEEDFEARIKLLQRPGHHFLTLPTGRDDLLENVCKFQSYMAYKLPIIFKRTRSIRFW